MTERIELICAIWLSLACGAGSSAPDLLFAKYGYSAEAIWRAEKEELASIPDLGEKYLAALTNKSVDTAKSIYEYCLRNNVGLLPISSPLYPQRLRAIRSAPVLLYYKGRLPDLDASVLIAMVGTRSMTDYGSRTAYTLSYDLARGGAVVVSGMAAGVDSVCHRGALDAGAHTIAVFGCGIDRCYPSENRELMDEIILRGTVITEFAPGTPPTGSNFPIRNRIISGLSQGTVVVEADQKSGAMITARTALMQGRDIYALPGKIGEKNSVGTNHLIKDGAKIITDADDILSEYQHLYPTQIRLGRLHHGKSGYASAYPRRNKAPAPEKKASDKKEKTPALEENFFEKRVTKSKTPVPEATKHAKNTPDLSALPENQRKIYEELMAAGRSADELAAAFDMPIGEIMAALTLLEISGYIKALPGGMYVRADI
ncbi:MAG: DNA-processing protein DprA [Clostridia bacterium]|nr:DNA-processing protein DprA [Clostridia bacterium]MBQ4576064.1 DNA-processing protein DprA [Clostridia bacterium]